MDQRAAELKALKKAYKRMKRKYVAVWKVCAVIFLLLAAGIGLISVWQGYPLADMAAFLESLGIDALVLQGAAAGCAALFLLFWVIAGLEKRKTKKRSEYLDYQTMKNTLKAEREAMK